MEEEIKVEIQESQLEFIPEIINKQPTGEIVLFTRKQKVRELSYLSQLIYKIRGTQPEDDAFRTDFVLPEALIVKVILKSYTRLFQAYSLLSGTNLVEKVTSESDIRDDIYGEYPFVLYKHFFITRRNLPRFCKMMTGINNIDRIHLSPDERGIID